MYHKDMLGTENICIIHERLGKNVEFEEKHIMEKNGFEVLQV